MPTYAYRCPRCAHAFERFHKMSDATAQACPECGETAERVITGGAGLVFKGSGFYITDYKRSAEDKGAGDKGQKKGEKKSGDTKDSAPASKPGPESSKSSGGDGS